MLAIHRNSSGFTFVELMVASTLALIALTAVLALYSSTVRHSTLQLQNADLHQQSTAVIHRIHSELKRAGYWSFDPTLSLPQDNPFQSKENHLRISTYKEEPENSCVLYSYDLDQDGLVGVGRCTSKPCPAQQDADNVEQFGYRLKSGRIQSRSGGRRFDCNSGYWQSITDSTVEFTQLAFTLAERCISLSAKSPRCNTSFEQLIQRAVGISLQARTPDSSDNTVSLYHLVSIRNDRLIERTQP